ncbi:MAG: acyltransferase, partial [Actinomycetota bacterium]|nr:acyltransferase [Actinomycetota bacterium]
LTAWRSLVRRGGTGAEYVRNRVLRLAQPALPLYVFYAVVLVVILVIGVDPNLVDTTVGGAGAPLWFLAAYTLCQAVVPLMVRLHARAPRLTVAGLLLGVIVVDAARYTAVELTGDAGLHAIGLLNLFFVWVLIQQFGFFYADGWFDRRSWWQLLAIPAACYGVLGLLVAYGPYSPDMLNNLNPPTLPLVLLGLAQACILRLLKPVLTALMRTKPAKAIVFLAGTRLMTIYLWHLPIIVIFAGLSLLIPGAAPLPASPAWWWSRILLYVLVLVAIFGLSFLVGSWEAPKEVTGVPPTGIVALAAAFTFIPNLAVLWFFLDLPLAILGSTLLAVAVLMLGRWPSRAPTG